MATLFGIIGWVLLALAVLTAICCWRTEERGLAWSIALFTAVAVLVLHYG